ncbi:hypothetical protein [Streptomyces sp. WG-D5]
MLKAERHDWDCRTCHGMRGFRQLKPHEEARLASEGHSSHDIGRTWRCATPGCLTLRRHWSPWHGSLPEDIDD